MSSGVLVNERADRGPAATNRAGDKLGLASLTGETVQVFAVLSRGEYGDGAAIRARNGQTRTGLDRLGFLHGFHRHVRLMDTRPSLRLSDESGDEKRGEEAAHDFVDGMVHWSRMCLLSAGASTGMARAPIEVAAAGVEDMSRERRNPY